MPTVNSTIKGSIILANHIRACCSNPKACGGIAPQLCEMDIDLVERLGLQVEDVPGSLGAVINQVRGACDFCARRRFNAADAANSLDIDLIGDVDQHHSLADLIAESWVVTTF